MITFDWAMLARCFTIGPAGNAEPTRHHFTSMLCDAMHSHPPFGCFIHVSVQRYLCVSLPLSPLMTLVQRPVITAVFPWTCALYSVFFPEITTVLSSFSILMNAALSTTWPF